MKKIIFLCLCFVLLGCQQGFSFKSDAFQKMLPSELKTKLDNHENFKIVDVREYIDYEQGHIANAISLPYDSGHFQAQYQSFDWGKDILIVVVDTYEDRADDTAKILKNSGFTSVKVLKGGMMDWQKAKYTIVND
jgi:rhodanese-related sulfurtransferase